jgi:anaerobic selenocysteine-containing dehydrogenase
MTDSLSRRNFLFFGGAAVTGVTLGQLARRPLAWADRQSRAVTGPGEERWAVSVCRECPAACGVHVRLIDGMPVKLEGNPLCPVARGRLCAKGQAGIEAYYDPDRVTGPARRVGPPGASAWERISWEEAIGMLVEQLGSVPTGPGELLAVAAEENGPAAGAWAGVWAAAGARLAWTSAATASHLRGRLASLTGVAAEPHFDFEHATYVLSLGAPLVEDWLSPVWAQRAYGRFRRSAWQPRGRLVQIEGRRSLTARKADEWIAVPEDRHVALVYGLAGVLLRENRIDREALEPHAGNLVEFERAVTTRFTPDEVATATGVPVVTILRLARELLSTVSPVVVVNADASRDLVDAVLALNAILGTFDRPGGIFSALPPVHEVDRIEPQPGRGSDTEPRVVLLRDAAEFRSLTVTPGFERALTTAELVVSFSPFLDEAASVADLLLPTHTALESWHAVVPPTGLPSQTIALARPAAEPLLETRDLITILKGIADAVGGPMTVACPWESSAELVREELTVGAAARARRVVDTGRVVTGGVRRRRPRRGRMGRPVLRTRPDPDPVAGSWRVLVRAASGPSGRPPVGWADRSRLPATAAVVHAGGGQQPGQPQSAGTLRIAGSARSPALGCLGRNEPRDRSRGRRRNRRARARRVANGRDGSVRGGCRRDAGGSRRARLRSRRAGRRPVGPQHSQRRSIAGFG